MESYKFLNFIVYSDTKIPNAYAIEEDLRKLKSNQWILVFYPLDSRMYLSIVCNKTGNIGLYLNDKGRITHDITVTGKQVNIFMFALKLLITKVKTGKYSQELPPGLMEAWITDLGRDLNTLRRLKVKEYFTHEYGCSSTKFDIIRDKLRAYADQAPRSICYSLYKKTEGIDIDLQCYVTLCLKDLVSPIPEDFYYFNAE